MDNRINASAIKHLHYEWYLKILSKLRELLGPFVRVGKFLIARAFMRLLIYYMAEKITKSTRTNLHSSAK